MAVEVVAEGWNDSTGRYFIRQDSKTKEVSYVFIHLRSPEGGHVLKVTADSPETAVMQAIVLRSAGAVGFVEPVMRKESRLV